MMDDPGVQEWQCTCRLHFDGELDGGFNGVYIKCNVIKW